MRTSLLKRFSAGIMAVATAATLFVGVSAADPDLGSFGGLDVKVVDVNGTKLTALTGDDDVIAIPVAAELKAGKTITVTVEGTPTAGSYFSDITATEVADINGTTPDSETLEITSDFTAPTLAKQPKIADLTGKKTVKFTLKAKSDIAASSTVYVQLSKTETAFNAADTAFTFWTGIVDRRVIPASAINGTTITIDYSAAADPSLLKITGDELPTITIGKAKSGKTTLIGGSAADYDIASISKDGEIDLGGTKYKVVFNTEGIAKLNATTWANDTLKSAMDYSVELTVGGTTYTVDKKTAAAKYDFTSTTLTFKTVTTATGSATVTFKGAYLYAPQSFNMSADDLKNGKTFTIVYKDSSSSSVTVKADATGITAATAGINSNAPTVAVLLDGKASTKYPVAVDSTAAAAGMTKVDINLVNDVLPETLQVKLTSDYIAGGSKTVDVDFYNQVFPIELVDGSYYYLSVNVDSTLNNLLPVTKFDFIGVASLNVDLLPLITWNQSNTKLNKILYVDYNGTMTDRVTYSGILNDGTTDKIFPSTSYYQPNTNYENAYYFYARWTEGQDLKGVSVKFTRPTVTFEITDPTTKHAVSYTAVFLNSKQTMDATAINSTLGGQASVTIETGEYTQTWKQANADTQYAKDKTTRTAGKINITSYYAGNVDLDNDYVMMTLRLPVGSQVTMDTTATGDIKSMTVVQDFQGKIGNTTVDGLVDYVIKFQYRELYTGKNTVGKSTLKVTYPLTNKDGTAATNAYKEYDVVTTWVAKSYIAEKKVTMAGITIPSAITEKVSEETSSNVTSSTTSSTSSTSSNTSSSSTSSGLPTNPKTGVPFNTLAYVVTIAASAIGGVSTMVIRKK